MSPPPTDRDEQTLIEALHGDKQAAEADNDADLEAVYLERQLKERAADVEVGVDCSGC